MNHEGHEGTRRKSDGLRVQKSVLILRLREEASFEFSEDAVALAGENAISPVAQWLGNNLSAAAAARHGRPN